MAVIYKNQVFQGYIKPQHGVHGPIRFSYKGLWPEFRAKYFRDLRLTAEDDDGEAVVVKMMRLMLVKWNLVYPLYPVDHKDAGKSGQPVPITEDSLRNEVMSHVRNHIMNIMTWAVGSDVDPEEPLDDQIKKINQRAEGRDLAEIMAEADAEMVGN